MKQVLTIEEATILAEKAGEELGEMWIKCMEGRIPTEGDIEQEFLQVLSDAMVKGISRVIDAYEGQQED